MTASRLLRLSCALLLAAAMPLAAQGRGTLRPLDVPFATTPHAAVAKMLEMAKVGPEDMVYDLGSGDGRIVIAAARDFGARAAIGVDLDPKRVAEGEENARQAGVADRVRFIRGDAFKVDFSEATVLAMYMSPRINAELLPRILKTMKPGSRVVVFRFPIPGWEPQRTETIGGQPVRFWVVPDRAETARILH
jgi:cyclopropane fatty-acyl-phospholipid synthase-like methyltransferase